jgi:ribose transport system substrate-binding protein
LETHRRRQTILALLKQAGELDVNVLATRLGVSANTIRNDFNALAASGQLQRVHGGAALPDLPLETSHDGIAVFSRRQAQNQAAKLQVARWAADMVEDGDSIVLDAGTTIYLMAHFLDNRRNLTVITNGVEVGRKLAQNSSNRVWFLGGLLGEDGVPGGSLLSEPFLKDIHIKTAFVSCSGFSPEAGLTEAGFPEAEIKSAMIGAAGAVVALIDSSKFGKVDLAPFARTEQIARIFTDSNLEPAWIEPVQRTCAVLTICDERSVTDYNRCSPELHHYRIGFANLGEQVPFAVDLRRGLEHAAQVNGNFDLVLADNQLSREVAFQVADRLIAERVDLAIEYQIDVSAADVIMARFRRARIPVIAVDIPIVGATFFGVDNYQAGYLAGLALGQWLLTRWQCAFDRLVLLEEQRAGPLPAARMRGQLDALQSIVGEVAPHRLIHVDSGNDISISQAHMEDTLHGLPAEYRLAVLSFNDDAAMGAIAAGRALGRAANLAVVGQGADRRARDELRRPDSPLIGSTAYYPERYGQHLLALAGQIMRQEPVPPAVYMDHAFITAENVDGHYPEV